MQNVRCAGGALREAMSYELMSASPLNVSRLASQGTRNKQDALPDADADAQPQAATRNETQTMNRNRNR